MQKLAIFFTIVFFGASFSSSFAQDKALTLNEVLRLDPKLLTGNLDSKECYEKPRQEWAAFIRPARGKKERKKQDFTPHFGPNMPEGYAIYSRSNDDSFIDESGKPGRDYEVSMIGAGLRAHESGQQIKLSLDWFAHMATGYRVEAGLIYRLEEQLYQGDQGQPRQGTDLAVLYPYGVSERSPSSEKKGSVLHSTIDLGSISREDGVYAGRAVVRKDGDAVVAGAHKKKSPEIFQTINYRVVVLDGKVTRVDLDAERLKEPYLELHQTNIPGKESEIGERYKVKPKSIPDHYETIGNSAPTLVSYGLASDGKGSNSTCSSGACSAPPPVPQRKPAVSPAVQFDQKPKARPLGLHEAFTSSELHRLKRAPTPWVARVLALPEDRFLATLDSMKRKSQNPRERHLYLVTEYLNFLRNGDEALSERRQRSAHRARKNEATRDQVATSRSQKRAVK